MFWKRNSLSIVLLALSLLFMVGQALSGHQAYNEELRQQGLAALPMWQYLHSGHFIGALFENWESEFLQMGMYLVLTVKLRQWGSAESRPLSPAQEDDNVASGPVPWPVRAGGLWLALYERSLALAFGTLFLLSFVLHALGSWRHEVAEQAMQHQPPPSFWEHVSGAQFWFESMQNWQSEFLAVFALVVLTIWLRQKDSPQSKPVHAPHQQTGD